MKIVYLFTTFPVLSETFLQREVRAMRALGVEIEVHSIWRGQKEFEGLPVQRFNKWRLLTLLWWLPYWLVKKPKPMLGLFKILFTRWPPAWLNFWETMLGLGFALTHAVGFSKTTEAVALFHAVWATVPASAGLLLRELTGIPYSMGAHAYDIYRHGGDWLLPEKCATARFIHTTTTAAAKQLHARGANPQRVHLVRRGLEPFPKQKTLRNLAALPATEPLRLLSVGRLIEKKGYTHQLRIYAALLAAGIPFTARIVGTGPLAKKLTAEIKQLGLSAHVQLMGKLNFEAVQAQYQWADVFIFTGKVAASGDRDGLPNVLAEAMAFGVPVFTTHVAGTTEAVEEGTRGRVLPLAQPAAWVSALQHYRAQFAQQGERFTTAARAWVETNFNARTNAAKLAVHLKAAAENTHGLPEHASKAPWRHIGG